MRSRLSFTKSGTAGAITLFSLVVLMSVGTYRAFERGGHDFAVFYEAARLVLQGMGSKIYEVSPDRFLYAPGFAWILAPFALLPAPLALGLWCLVKTIALFWILVELSALCRLSSSQNLRWSSLASWGFAAAGVLFLARPLLIDLEYGQVNLLILFACLWGLLSHTGGVERKEREWKSVLIWILLSFLAVAKVFPLPLLAVPFLVTRSIPRTRLLAERLGILLGVFLALGTQILTEGWSQGFHLLIAWKNALYAKGLPLESHNQSFAAFLHHYFSGNPTHVISSGPQPLLLGGAHLSVETIAVLSLLWTGLFLTLLVAWISVGSRISREKWTAVLLALLIVPSHLVWKPYFIFSMPLAAYLIRRCVEKRASFYAFLLLTFFIGINFTSFDFIGHDWSARLEAGSLLFLIHFGMILLAGFL